ncbi:MAG: hypothetical protein GEU90_18235 [Gemmatimonas sp.]|nr:hypothetical protein [Gemmatimonas sp.]
MGPRAYPPPHALGAEPRSILIGIFTRSGVQLGGGVLAGLSVAAVLEWAGPGGTMGGRASILLPIVSALMLAVGVLAALGPARRALSAQPMEALREEY